MSNQYINGVRAHTKTTGFAKFLMIALAEQANEDGVTWPSFTSLAEYITTTRRHVIRLIQDLIELGEIEVIENRKGRASNVYRILLQPEEKPPKTKGKRQVTPKSPKPVTPVSPVKTKPVTPVSLVLLPTIAATSDIWSKRLVTLEASTGDICDKIAPPHLLMNPKGTLKEKNPKRSINRAPILHSSGPIQEQNTNGSRAKEFQKYWAPVEKYIRSQIERGMFESLYAGIRILNMTGTCVTVEVQDNLIEIYGEERVTDRLENFIERSKTDLLRGRKLEVRSDYHTKGEANES